MTGRAAEDRKKRENALDQSMNSATKLYQYAELFFEAKYLRESSKSLGGAVFFPPLLLSLKSFQQSLNRITALKHGREKTSLLRLDVKLSVFNLKTKEAKS